MCMAQREQECNAAGIHYHTCTVYRRKQMQTTGVAQRMNTTVNHQQIGHVLAMRDMHQ